MENRDFIPYFIEEDIYVIEKGSDAKKIKKSSDITTSKSSDAIILVDEKKFTHSDQVFLEKILTAINLTLSDIHLIKLNHINDNDEFNKIVDLKFKVLICFDIAGQSSIVPEGSRKYQIIQNPIDDTTPNMAKILLADGLDNIITDKEKKIKLWETLKQLFPQTK